MTGTRIHTVQQLLEVLDQVVEASGRGDRSRTSAADYWSNLLTTPGHPLTTQLPDEPLVDWHERGLLGELAGARVLDVGCGGGRNSRWFAEQSAVVDGVDLAGELLDTVRTALPDTVTLTTADILRDPLPYDQYDVVYDSGCFHHIAPHRRITYLERVLPLVRAGGRFGIVAFAGERMETPADADIVGSGDTYGGMSFSLDDLRTIFDALSPVELRPAAYAGCMTGERTLRLDVLYCAVAAVGLVGFAGPLAELAGVPAVALTVAGVGVLGWAGYLAYLTAKAPRRQALRVVLAVNVVATLGIAVAAVTSQQVVLTALLAAVAVEVGAFAVSQALALKAISRQPAN